MNYFTEIYTHIRENLALFLYCFPILRKCEKGHHFVWGERKVSECALCGYTNSYYHSTTYLKEVWGHIIGQLSMFFHMFPVTKK